MDFFQLAYIDPGVGSLAAQVIIAGIAAFVVFFKNSFRSIFFFFRKKDEDKNQEV